MKNLISVVIISAIITGSGFAEAAGKEVKLTQGERKLLNTFFSNFSEVFVEPFEKGKLSDKEMILFAVHHNYLNNQKRFVKGGKEYIVKIKAEYIDESAEKFFGKKIKKHQPVEPDGVEYKDGWYFITEASGEELCFSQIVNLFDNGNNLYKATVNVYVAGSGWTGDVHGTEKEWKKIFPDNVPEILCVMNATLQKVTAGGKSRYILIDYIKVK